VTTEAYLLTYVSPNAYCQPMAWGGGGTLAFADAVRTPNRAKRQNALIASCSASSACGCAYSYDIGHICTQQASCSCAKPCDVNGTCADPDTTCVMDERCQGRALCYPASLMSVQSCPPFYTANGDAMKRPKRRVRLSKQA
jgi:hypothetical protein